jgi:hypothetical protein
MQMTWRIGDTIVRGELINTSRNTVHGWLDFGGDYGIRIELVGNLSGELAGRRIRFEIRPAPAIDPTPPPELESLQTQQIGVVGSMTLRTVRVPVVPIRDSSRGVMGDEAVRTEERPCLYLEWFSQDGQMVAEIVDPDLQFVSEDELPPELDPSPPLEIPWDDVEFPGARPGDEENGLIFDAEADDEPHDPFGLFPPDLDEQLDEANRQTELERGESPPSGLHGWDEVIPGIDDETKQMYEQWDEIFYGARDEPLTTLFDPPLHLTPPAQVASESEAEQQLRVLLAALALHGVALDMCEHCTAREAYRILVDEILPDAQIHPNLPASGFVQHYATWESCPQCLGENGLNEDLPDEDLPNKD